MFGPRLSFIYRLTPVSDVEDLFGLLPLHLRRQHADLFLFFWLVNGHIDCSAQLGSIKLSILRETRSRSIFCRLYTPPDMPTTVGSIVSSQLEYDQLGLLPWNIHIVQKESDVIPWVLSYPPLPTLLPCCLSILFFSWLLLLFITHPLFTFIFYKCHYISPTVIILYVCYISDHIQTCLF